MRQYAALAIPYGKKGKQGMAGKIKYMIDDIIARRAKGNEILVKVMRTKLVLKGINPDKYTIKSEDDQAIIGKLEKMLQDL